MKTLFKIILFFGVIGALITGYRFFISNPTKKLETIHLAVSGPMDQDDQAGTTFYRAAQLFLDQHNESAQSRGYKLVLDRFNDQNKAEVAAVKAKEIAQNNKILGVIGHNYSSVSLSAGKVYQQEGIAAISPTSTSNQLTEGNDWYFRNIFNNQFQGTFLANYAKKVMKRNFVILIHQDQPYGANLAKIFETATQQTGMQVRKKMLYHAKSDQLEQEFESIVKQVVALKNDDLIFISGHYSEGNLLIKMLRDAGMDNQILVPDSYANPLFTKGFEIYPRENEKPGYYSNDLFVAVPLLYASSNYQAVKFYQDYLERYGVAPDWRAAFAYDAALLFATAIEKTGISQKKQSTKLSRTAIRDYLKKLNAASQGLKGTTGLNYFDEQGNSLKPITIGQYKNRILIPAMTQLQPISDLKDVPDLQEALKDELVIKVGKDYLYKTNIIYTGVNINEVTNIDLENYTYSLDFDLWFRYRGDSDVRDIEFLNAVKPIQLRMPSEEIRLNNQLYRRYHLVGTFQADFIPPSDASRHMLGVSFSHKSMPRKNLIFVPDIIGDDIREGGKARREDQRILPLGSDWKVDKIWSFQDIFPRKILGNIKYINEISKRVNYSKFTTVLEIQNSVLTFRNSLSSLKYAYSLMGLSLILGVLFHRRTQLLNRSYNGLLHLRKKARQKQQEHEQQHAVMPVQKAGFSYFDSPEESAPKSIFHVEKPLISKTVAWFVTSVALLIALYALETITIQLSFGRTSPNNLMELVSIFDLLWWVVPTHIISTAVKNFVWDLLEEKANRKVPPFLRAFFTFVLYAVMLFGIIAFVYDQKIASILGTSGIFVMIIGLAVQMNISNVVAGLVLNMERSIRVDDWIQLGGMEEGKVLEINWRTTKIVSRNGTILHIPNNTISESEFQNYTTPNNVVCLWFFLDLDKTIPHSKVSSLLLPAVESVEGVMDPAVRFADYTHWSAKYIIVYNIDDYGKKAMIKAEIWVKVLDALNRENFRSANMSLNMENGLLDE